MAYCGCHSCKLSIGIISGCNFDDIGRDQVDTLKSTDDCSQFACRPSSSFWSTCSRSDYKLPISRVLVRSFVRLTSRIKGIDIDTQIYRVLRSYSVLDLFDDAFSSNGVNLASFGDLKTAIAIIFIVRRPR